MNARARSYNYSVKLQNLFLHIINYEHPIELELLYRRVSSLIGVKRGSKVEELFDSIINTLIKSKTIYMKDNIIDIRPIKDLRIPNNP